MVTKNVMAYEALGFYDAVWSVCHIGKCLFTRRSHQFENEKRIASEAFRGSDTKNGL